MHQQQPAQTEPQTQYVGVRSFRLFFERITRNRPAKRLEDLDPHLITDLGLDAADMPHGNRHYVDEVGLSRHLCEFDYVYYSRLQRR